MQVKHGYVNVGSEERPQRVHFRSAGTGPPLLRLDAEGTHFLKTWHWLRDRQLFWPWYAADAEHALSGQANLDADYLSACVTEFWQAQPALDELWPQVLNYPLAANMDRLGCSVELCVTATDPLAELGRRSLPGRSFNIRSEKNPTLTGDRINSVPDN